MDFRKLPHEEIASFAARNRDEVGASGLEAEDILDALKCGRAALEVREHAFALVELKQAMNGKAIPHLWILYVIQERRGQGEGKRLVKDLLRAYATDYHMSLSCDGPRRRAFFGRLGFRVESRDGGMRRMTTNPILR